MKKTIQDLAYLIKRARDNNEPKPIVFLGAGVSVSGDIPLASGIIKRILTDYKDKPSINNLSKEEKGDYYELMSALNAKERRELFQNYIIESKINIAHIYLAQLVKLGYVDYVLTVNFDDLLLRACGLYNYTMPTYDISNLDNFTTTTFQKGSIIYLHGQHYGEWLLNAKGELERDSGRVTQLLNKICHNRTWIIAGYSGEDNVFNEINKFSSFDNELYWISYLDHRPSDNVQNNLLDIETKNAHLISGYDADTFFLDLHAKLKIETPKIIDKPFSFLQSMIKEINVPNPNKIVDKHKELYKSLSERMEITTDWVNKAIEDIQEEDSIEKFKQEIIEAYLKEKFDKEELFLEKIKQPKFKTAKEDLADFYLVFGNSIANLAELKNSEKLFLESIEKYKKAMELNPKDDAAYNNLGTSIYHLAVLNNNKKLFLESIENFKKAIELNPKDDKAYYNWGTSISKLAMLNNNEKLFLESIEKYKKAIEINPKNDKAYINLGNSISELANLNNSEKLFLESIEKYKKAIEINPKDYSAYNNWGNSIADLANLNNSEKLFLESIEKYKKAIEINPKNDSAYNNWGNSILKLTHLKKDPSLLKEAVVVLKKGYDLGGSAYNLSCAYALLKDKENALKYLKETLSKNEITKEHVLKDDDWKDYLKDKDFITLLQKFN